MKAVDTGDVQLLDDGSIAPVRIDVTVVPQYFLATAHRRPVPALSVTNLSLEPDQGDDELVVTLEVDSVLGEPPLLPVAVAVPLPDISSSTDFNHFTVQPNRRVLARLEERVQALVVVTARLGDTVVGVVRRPIEFLAHNQWMFAPAYFDSLAAFVQPNSPSIDAILVRARSLLLERTGSSSTEGYQSTSVEGSRRIHQIAEAVFDALRELRLDYTDPPASFEGAGQKVRTPEVVMAERAATCLDSAALYASCLSRAGLSAQIVVLKEHALTSYSVIEQQRMYAGSPLAEPVMSNVNVFDQLVAAGDLQLVETTDFTTTHDTDFVAATGSAHRRCEQPGKFRAMVNVASAIQGGVVPLPARDLVLSGEGLEPTEITWLDEIAAAPIGSLDEAATTAGPRRERVAHPPRVESWLRSLLDLSYRNPLIRMRTSSRSVSVLDLDLPVGVASVVEDRLMAGGKVVVERVSRAPSGLTANPDDPDVYGEHVLRSGKVYYPGIRTLDAHQQQALSQIEADHPGLPMSRLVAEAESWVDQTYARDLDRLMRGLKRRANDIERRTGSNNLFLCLGQLYWVADDDREGSAPLFLIPVRITGSAEQGYAIAADESAEVMPNWALMEKLRQSYGISLPSLESPVIDDSGIDVDALIAGVRAELADERIKNAKVSDSLKVAVLDFSSFRLWRDLYDHWETFLESPVLNHLVNTPSADFVDPADRADSDSDTSDHMDISRLLCPVEADESQLEAVRAAVEGRTFVLEGPPGTGKSQTITNLLAASMASGMKVLFVAEKSAALDVVRKRLDSVGLGPLCLELFDKEAKPDHIRSQIRAALDLRPPDISVEWTDVTNRVDSGERRLSDYRDAIHTPGPTGLSLWAAQQETTRLGDGPMADLPQGLTRELVDDTTAVAHALIDLPRVVAGDVVDNPHHWALSTRSDLDEIDIPRLSWAVQVLSWARSVFEAQEAAVVEVLRSVEDPDAYGLAGDALGNAVYGAQLTLDKIDAVGTPQWLMDRDLLLADVSGFTDDIGPILEVFRPNVLVDDLSGVIEAGKATVGAGMLGRRRAHRQFIIELLPFLIDPETQMDATQLLALLHRIPQIRERWARAHTAATTIVGVRLPQEWSLLDPDSVHLLREQLELLPGIAEVGRSPLARTLIEHVDLSMPRDDLNRLIESLKKAADGWNELLDQLGADAASVQRWLAGRPFTSAWVESEPGWNADDGRFLHLQRYCVINSTLKPVSDAGLDGFVDSILRGQVPVSDAETRFRRAVVDAAIRDRLEESGLERFDGLAHDRVVEDFASYFNRRRTMMVERIPSELVSRRPLPPGKRIGKWGELERHLASTRRRMSIRKLMEDYGRFVGDLTPCFLMSPDSVARFIPPGSITFDLVVFDEASQIEVPRGAGALGRARAAVIVGDTKQMPPSRFGGRSENDEDEPGDGMVTEITDLESLLEESKESRLPTLTLKCHYRSRHEALIAFSNRNFYDGDLTTFPSPVASYEAPIQWRRVDGRFRRRSRRLPANWDEQADPWPIGTNLIEARAVVDEICRRLADPELATESIGVVTSNQPQRELIQDLLIDLGDARILELLERDDDQGLLIQNLENVQGDERDVILMSVGFSPEIDVDEAGVLNRDRLPMNFGPLNQKGGERRLNVAITRARSSMVVFCSFDPEEMSVGAESPRGIQLLHSFLASARDGAMRSGDIVGRAPSVPDRHRRSIAEELRSRGLVVQENVGLSRFRVDLAVGLPGDEGFRVAVLLDGPTWADRELPYDRDVLPVTVLEGLMGWSSVVRVWLPMWLRARDEVLDEIVEAVRVARPGVNSRGADPAVEPELVPTRDQSLRLVRPEQSSSTLTIAVASGSVVPTPLLPPDVDGATVGGDDEGVMELVASVDERHTSADVFGGEIPEFGAGVDLSVVGPRTVLDSLPDSDPGYRVGRVMKDLVTTLGPVEQEMLCKLVAARFDLSRVTRSRVDAISSIVPTAWVRRSTAGTFVWANDMDPARWTGFRRNADHLTRHLDQTAPEEIRNAMVHCVRLGTEVREAELFDLVSNIFGHKRQTTGVKQRLRLVADVAVEQGYLERTDDGSYLIGDA